MKKVISFCWYNDIPRYNVGLLENIRLRDIIYPDWLIRVYFFNVNAGLLSDLKNTKNLELVEIKNNKGETYGRFCRFFPSADKNVDVFISRDLDSRLNYREAVAVNQWLEGSERLHAMRDHPHHVTKPIMGGMWGLKGNFDIVSLTDDFKDFDRRSCDQDFLKSNIWPIFKNDCISHDAYPTGHWGESSSFPEHKPLLLEGSYVGEQYNEFNKPVYIPFNKKVVTP